MALALSTKKNSMLIYIIGIGLLTGTLDAVAAIIYNWKIPSASIFKYIASGAFGKTVAYAGGTNMVIWGVFFHYLIAFIFTTTLFLLHPMFYSWFRNKLLTAIFYGILIWVIMNIIVVPLTSLPARPFNFIHSLIDCSILIVCFGLPISFIATGYYFYKAR